MQLSHSKLMLRLGSETVLARTLKAFTQIERLERIVICARPSDISEFSQIASKFRLPVDIVEGGETRRASVLNALQFMRESFSPPAGSFVVIHDAARCFVSPALISECIDQSLKYRAVSAALPIVDTLKRVADDGVCIESIDRKGLWAMQTPQVFEFELLYRAHLAALSDPDLINATDDVTLVEKLEAVRVVAGERSNLKITTSDDLELAEKLVANL